MLRLKRHFNTHADLSTSSITSSDAMVGLRRLSSAGESIQSRHSREKLRRMSKTDSTPEEDDSDVASNASAQVGVKKLEATAAMWSKWSLIFAYAGYVDKLCAFAPRLESSNSAKQIVHDGILDLARRASHDKFDSICHQLLQRTCPDFDSRSGTRCCTM